MSKAKTFVFKGRNLKVIPVNNEIRTESQSVYSKAFAAAVAQGYMLKGEVDKLLKAKGLADANDPELEAQIDKQRTKVKDMEIRLKKGRHSDGKKMSLDEGRQLALEIRKERNKLVDLNSSPYANLYNSTAESSADNERLQFLIYATAYDVDAGSKIWSSFEDFKNSNDMDLASEVTGKFLELFVEIDPDDANYEIRWLKKFGFMNEKGQLTRKDGKLIDENGRLIDENGRYINDKGEFVDIDGNRVDEKGRLLVEDGWELVETPQS